MTRKMPLTYRVCTDKKRILALIVLLYFKTHVNLCVKHQFQVILESLRKASIISFTFREATVDVEYDGE